MTSCAIATVANVANVARPAETANPATELQKVRLNCLRRRIAYGIIAGSEDFRNGPAGIGGESFNSITCRWASVAKWPARHDTAPRSKPLTRLFPPGVK